MSLGYQKEISPAAAPGAEPQGDGTSLRLNINVIFTSVTQTLAAVERASELASRLDARITLVVMQTVPYPIPLESPPVLLEFNENRFRTILQGTRVDASVCIYLCRDRWEALKRVLAPHSLVMLGGRYRWWPTVEARLARRLCHAGHEVILTDGAAPGRKAAR